MTTAVLTLADAARMMRDAVKDKSYRATAVGLEVAQYLRYFRNQRGATDSSLRDYESCLAKLALDHADLGLADFEPPVGTQRIEEFLYHHWEDRDPRTFAKNRSILVSFFDWAVRKQKLYGNPARAVDSPRKQAKRAKLLAPSLRSKIVDAQGYAADRLGCRLIVYYGLRRAELGRLQLRHFDFERARIKVHGKGRKEREVPLDRQDEALWADIARWQLDTLAGPSTYVLYRRDVRRMRVSPEEATETLDVPGRGTVGYADVTRVYHDRELSGNSIHRWWYRCLERASVVDPGETSGAGMHSGRHTAITELLRSGKIDLKMAQLLAGHSDIRTTANIYDHRDIEDLADALDGLFAKE